MTGHKRRRESLGREGSKWARIVDVYYAKIADSGEEGVKKWDKDNDVFYVWPLISWNEMYKSWLYKELSISIIFRIKRLTKFVLK